MASLATQVGFAVLLSGCAANPPQSSEVEYFPVPGQRPLPFAEAVRVGEMLYLSGQLGTPESVELGAVEVGHFHGLKHEGDGRIAYLYEARIPGHRPRHGFVKLGDAAASASA